MKLGINIDHVATLRQARKGFHPDVAEAALEAVRGGSDNITVHLREDRRHIQDADLFRLKKLLRIPLNLEMSLAPSIVKIALRLRPEKACIVPERRQELTTEGGLDVVTHRQRLGKVIRELRRKGIEVSLFVDPSTPQIEMSAKLGSDAVEIHTGAYANARGRRRPRELAKIRNASKLAARLGLRVHAGHGLDYENIKAIARISGIREVNIGHSIVADAVFNGLRNSVRKMKHLLSSLRGGRRLTKQSQRLPRRASHAPHVVRDYGLSSYP